MSNTIELVRHSGGRVFRPPQMKSNISQAHHLSHAGGKETIGRSIRLDEHLRDVSEWSQAPQRARENSVSFSAPRTSSVKRGSLTMLKSSSYSCGVSLRRAIC